MTTFTAKINQLFQEQEELLQQPNKATVTSNGVFQRYQRPVITAAHSPIFWRYDLNPESNPCLMERIGINAAFNAGAILLNNKIHLVVRMEGVDRKSFFAVAESENGIDNFCFWNYPIAMPELPNRDVNVYDMRLVQHEDGWIYGLFCTERKDKSVPDHDQSSAIAQCGIARTKDLKTWERLPDLATPSQQQRNVVLHPEFIDGQYALYTRPQDGFISAGKGGGIGWALTSTMEGAVVTEEQVIDPKVYHTIKEVKNGLGPAPIKTTEGWLHLAHGVRNTAAGLRYVLYLFMTSLDDPTLVIHQPAGHFMAPEGEERVGDVSNVVFSNGWVLQPNGEVLIYYASSDTRLHVATSTVDRLIDYCQNTLEDGLHSADSVANIHALIKRNMQLSSETINAHLSQQPDFVTV